LPRPKGLPKTGGRKKGSVSKFTPLSVQYTRDIVDAAIKAQQTPLEFLLAQMHDPRVARQERFAAAVAAAPFCHPKLIATAVTKVSSGGDGLPPDQYRAWARQQIREAFGLPPLTAIEHKAEEPAAVAENEVAAPASKIVPLTTWTPCPETALKRK
jgi:hypothetical protein